MIKNLTSYRNKWVPKWYMYNRNGDGTIFNISSSKDSDECGSQVINVNLTGDELGRVAYNQSCGISIKFEVGGEDKIYYFPMQQLIEDGDLIKLVDRENSFIQAHPAKYHDTPIRNYYAKFMAPIDEELISYIMAGKKFEDVYAQLPAWLTVQDDTENLSINDFIKGNKKVYTQEEIDAGAVPAKLIYVNFHYTDRNPAPHFTSLNDYTEEFVKDIFRQQIALMGVNYINDKLKKQLNSQMNAASTQAVEGMTIEDIPQATELGNPSGSAGGSTVGSVAQTASKAGADKLVIVREEESLQCMPAAMVDDYIREQAAALAGNELGEGRD